MELYHFGNLTIKMKINQRFCMQEIVTRKLFRLPLSFTQLV
jgi:hypothetical protein